MTRKIFAAFLAASIPWTPAAPAFAGVCDGGGFEASAGSAALPRTLYFSSGDRPNIMLSEQDFIYPLMRHLSALNPVEQLDQLQAYAAENENVRRMAAAVVAPESIIEKKSALQSKSERNWKVDENDVTVLTTLAVSLHIAARSDERVRAGLEALARQVAPESPWAQGGAGRVFDGGKKKPADLPEAPEAETETQFSPAVTWPAHGESDYRPRVQAITAQGGRILINGKRADALQEKEIQGHVVQETFVHPSEPGLLVKLYHSPDMGGFEKKSAKVEHLEALSAAGAVPKFIEHGEAPVAGRGRVYFYVQELIAGLKLKDMLPGERPLGAVAQLFERLVAAGLRLTVPGPNQEWLLSHIMIAETPEGGSRAYLVGGAAVSHAAEGLAQHYGMLLSILQPGNRPDEPKREEPAAPAPPPAQPSDLFKRSAQPLYALIKLLPDKQDQAILKIPGSAYALTPSADILSILWMLSPGNFHGIPEEAWRNLSRPDAELLMKKYLENNANSASAIARLWMLAHHSGRPSDNAEAMEDLRELLKILPASFRQWLLDELQMPMPAEPAKPVSLPAAPTGAAQTPRILDALDESKVGLAAKFIPVAPGEFDMGSDNGDPNRMSDETWHRARIDKPFFLQAAPVTQAQYALVMGRNPARNAQHPANGFHPVENVSWYDAIAFANKLSKLSGLQPYYEVDGDHVSVTHSDGFRLPTEAEWEYAASAGQRPARSGWLSDDKIDLDRYAWHAGNSGDSTHPVGKKEANRWGFHDMLGNVLEWVFDWYGPYPNNPEPDYQGPESGQGRGARGGSFIGYEHLSVRFAARGDIGPNMHHDSLGFRLARDAADSTTPQKTADISSKPKRSYFDSMKQFDD